MGGKLAEGSLVVSHSTVHFSHRDDACFVAVTVLPSDGVCLAVLTVIVVVVRRSFRAAVAWTTIIIYTKPTEMITEKRFPSLTPQYDSVPNTHIAHQHTHTQETLSNRRIST